MNTYTEFRDSEAEVVARPAEISEIELRQSLRPLRRASCLLVATLLLGGAGYFVATASLTVLLGVGIGLLALLGILVSVGLYSLNNVR